MSAAPALEFLQHPDLPQLVFQYLEPRDIHKLCTCNSEIWQLMIADLTLLKSYYWNYYGPVLTLFRLEHLPYLLRVGNQKPIRALQDLYTEFLHTLEVRRCQALLLYVQTMVRQKRAAHTGPLIQYLHKKFSYDWRGIYREIRGYQQFSQWGWSDFYHQDVQLYMSNGHILLQNKSQMLRVLLNQIRHDNWYSVSLTQQLLRLIYKASPLDLVFCYLPGMYKYMEDLFLVQCMKNLVLFHLHNPELFSFDIEALIYELIMVKSFNSPLDWLKIFDDPEISDHIKSQALWTVIMHFQWDNYNRGRGEVGDFRSHTDELGALVGERELQKLMFCDIDQLITECSSLYHMMFILGLGQRLKGKQALSFYKRIILRAIDCATKRPHSAALSATILFLPRLDMVNLQIRSLGLEQMKALCFELSALIQGGLRSEEDLDPIDSHNIYYMLFLINTFTNTAVLQIAQKMILSSLGGGKNLGMIVKFCVELWIFEPHILDRVSLRSRYDWMDQLLTVLVEHFEVIKSQCGQFSTVVFATFLKTWVSEDGCMLMVQTMLKICDNYGFDAALEEVDNFCEHVYLRLEAGYDIEGRYLDMMQTVEAHVIPLLQERNFDEEDQTYILRRFLVNSDHYGGIVSETDSDSDGENAYDLQEK
ncbi:hypothetical protein MP228_002823 [Amoeboaphelidium protococcarum]|nr:hypothetical protein MP228_002823 [Amoeboaphelidium protococcarum]